MLPPETLAENVAARVFAGMSIVYYCTHSELTGRVDMRAKNAPSAASSASSQIASTPAPSPAPSLPAPVSPAACPTVGGLEGEGVGDSRELPGLSSPLPDTQGSTNKVPSQATFQQLAHMVESNFSLYSPSLAAGAVHHSACPATLTQQPVHPEGRLENGERYLSMDSHIVHALENMGKSSSLSY